MNKSNWPRLVSLWVLLLLSSVFVWGQDSANTTSSGSLETAQTELLNSIDSLLSLEKEWQTLNDKMQDLSQQIQSLQMMLGSAQNDSEKLRQQLSDSRKALQSASERSTELGKLLDQQRKSLATLKQNYEGLLRLSKKLQESLQESKDWNLALSVVAGSLAVGWTLYAIIRK